MATKRKPADEVAESRERSKANLKPPWKPGESGNANGRPKGASVTAALRRQLNKEGMVRKRPGGPLEPSGREVAEHLAQVAIDKALRGDFKFFRYITDRLEGRTPVVVSPRSGDPRQELADLLGIDAEQLPD